MKKFAIFLCFIFVFAMSFFAYKINFVFADSEIIEINNENISEILEDFDVNGSYKLTENIELSGTNCIINNFSGTFDGNGKTITINLNLTGGNAGLFGKLINAEIKNLFVVVNVKNLDEIESAVNFGGIAGEAVGGIIDSCKTVVNFYNENQPISSNQTLNFGGIVGKTQGTIITNSFAQNDVKFEATNEANFGGIVGKMANGRIENCYAAPNQTLIDNLEGVVSEIANFNITNNGSSSVCFGGIVGYLEGSSFNITSVLSIAYLNQQNVVFGGLVGKINPNELYLQKSDDITYGKYLKVSNSTMSTFNKAVGNIDEIPFVVHSSNEEITTFPTNADYFENGTFDDIKAWDFNQVWKKQNIYDAGGLFLPDLQIFSSLTISLQYQNYANYYELTFDGEDKSVTSKEFSIGAPVKLKVKLKSTQIDGTNIIPEKFYQIVCLRKIGTSDFAENLIKDGDEYYYEFDCSNKTAGSYYVEIKGKPVSVYVHIQNDEGVQNSAANTYGKIKYLNEEKTQQFSFSMNYADDSDVKTIEAVEISDAYKFAGFKDENNAQPHLQTNSKSFQFKLNNLNQSLPKVVCEEDELVCNIYATFSNNTTSVEFGLTKDAGKILIDGQEIVSKKSISLIANKEYEIQIVANEGYEINKILLNNSEIELNNNKIQFSKSENNKFNVKFSKIETEQHSVNIWWIIIPIVSALAIAGIVVLIVFTIKRKNENSYKKHFRY